MKHKLLIFLVCLFGISNVNAQFSASPEKIQKIDGQQFRSATDGSLYFGYSDENITTVVGTGSVSQASAAIYIPASLSGLYAGKKITKIHIGLTNDCTNVSVWIRNSLSGTNLVSQTVGDTKAGWTEVTLNTPFTIPSNSFYIGYTATGYNQLGFSGISTYDGCWLWGYDDVWFNYSEAGWGSLCIKALLDSQGETILAVQPESLPKTVLGTPNQNLSISCNVKNYSSIEVKDVKIEYQIDNQTVVEKTIQISIAAMKSGSISIPVNAIPSTGVYKLSVKITEINGQPNPLANTTLSSEIRILSAAFPRKVVMEEGTGTWCGWCPRGTVGMAMFKEKYPDSFIGIAVHDGDQMTVNEYNNYMTPRFYKGFPGAVINRKSDLVCDPYPIYGSENLFLSEMEQLPIAGINLAGGFVDTNKKAISLKTATTFSISVNNANYTLAYVLIENGITGYSQQNNYSGSSESMGGYENKPSVITNMVFDDVARGIYSSPTGISGSIPASIKEMELIEHNYTINLPNTIKNADKLEVVVMLLNANTGEIENADKINITGIFTDINNPKQEAVNAYVNNLTLFIESEISETIDVYTADGVKIFSMLKTAGFFSTSCNHFPKGLLIVKGSSGWVKKVNNI